MFVLPKLSKSLNKATSLVLSGILLGSVFTLPTLAMDGPEEKNEKRAIFAKPQFSNPPFQTPMATLPDEIVLQHIFYPLRGQEIVSLRPVCQQWKERADQYVIWKCFGKSSENAFLSSESFSSTIPKAIDLLQEQKPYMRMLVFGRNTSFAQTYEFSNEQITTIDSIITSAFAQIKLTQFPFIRANTESIKFLLDKINDFSRQKYPGIAPKKPLLVFLNDLHRGVQNPYSILSGIKERLSCRLSGLKKVRDEQHEKLYKKLIWCNPPQNELLIYKYLAEQYPTDKEEFFEYITLKDRLAESDKEKGL
jgi:hypothetical protein